MHADTVDLVCGRCDALASGVVAVAALDAGAAAQVVAEVPLCTEHLADVAPVLGFERPEELR